jgi:hypothetical protein
MIRNARRMRPSLVRKSMHGASINNQLPVGPMPDLRFRADPTCKPDCRGASVRSISCVESIDSNRTLIREAQRVRDNRAGCGQDPGSYLIVLLYSSYRPSLNCLPWSRSICIRSAYEEYPWVCPSHAIILKFHLRCGTLFPVRRSTTFPIWLLPVCPAAQTMDRER